MSAPLPMTAVTVLFVVTCWVADTRRRRIPNVLTGPVLIGGIVVNSSLLGWSGLISSLSGAGAAVAALIVPFALGGIGGGDVKMMVGVGALLGPLATVSSLVLGMMIGGVIMGVHLVRLGRLREKLAATREMVVAAVLTRSLAPLKAAADRPGAIALPYSVPLGLGTIAVVMFGGIGA